MDRDISTDFRLRLILGKFRVIKIAKGLNGWEATIDLGNSITMTIDCPIHTDLQLHDLLTFYTEVPYAEPKPPSQ